MTEKYKTAYLLTGKQLAILREIKEERARQQAKWGEQNHPNGTGPARRFLGTSENFWELADIAQSRTDARAVMGLVTYADILLEEVFEALAEEDPEELRTELIQTAAVCVQWVEKIDRDKDQS